VRLLLGLRPPLIQVAALLVQLLVLLHAVDHVPFGVLDARRVPDADLEARCRIPAGCRFRRAMGRRCRGGGCGRRCSARKCSWGSPWWMLWCVDV
jgi:hypothetical protein